MPAVCILSQCTQGGVLPDVCCWCSMPQHAPHLPVHTGHVSNTLFLTFTECGTSVCGSAHLESLLSGDGHRALRGEWLKCAGAARNAKRWAVLSQQLPVPAAGQQSCCEVNGKLKCMRTAQCVTQAGHAHCSKEGQLAFGLGLLLGHGRSRVQLLCLGRKSGQDPRFGVAKEAERCFTRWNPTCELFDCV